MSIKERLKDRLRRLGLMGPWWMIRKGPPRLDGWLESVRRMEPVDRQGQPLPWITYPAIDFLSRRIPTGIRVFEWGSGNSTRWWAPRVAEVHSCEHDQAWFDRMSGVLPANCTLRHRDLGHGYVEAMAEVGGEFQIAVVDGRRRKDCARASLANLSPDGVVVWDNTERDEYIPGLDDLRAAGFHRVDFWGLAPMLVEKTCTSILFRPRNVLGI